MITVVFTIPTIVLALVFMGVVVAAVYWPIFHFFIRPFIDKYVERWARRPFDSKGDRSDKFGDHSP